ncbi:thioredoxin family protein [Pedobacter sp. AW1-32]|uniref:thioredoxin family protein n=1 Tax=Pedobacter sp. AW1-32 TaxID=3383026 RepID=UPI003FF0FE26
MKTLLKTVILCLSILFANAQDQKSINFINNLSWSDLKQKASAEEKFILIDFSTTWCVPCKKMEHEVFTKENVFEFANKNFTSTYYQCDTSANDAPSIKNRYSQAKALEKEFNVYSYPTFIILNSQGQEVHKIVGYRTDSEFISELKRAIDPATQHGLLTAQYDKGNRDPEFLLKLINSTKNVFDFVALPKYVNTYLTTQDNKLSADNIKLAMLGAKSTSDLSFDVLVKNEAAVDEIAGKNKTANVIVPIVFYDLAVPELRVNGKVNRDASGMMIMFEGELNKNINWKDFETKMTHSYPAFADKIIAHSKANYFMWDKDWQKLAKVVSSSLAQKQLSQHQVTRSIDAIFYECADKKILKTALSWTSNEQLKEDSDLFWSKSKLMYKLGQTSEALALLKSNRKADADNTYLESIIDKMEKGVSPWE